MASTLADSKDQPRLSVVITSQPSSSPFPSPGSSFLPPPRPGEHEFAIRPPSRLVRKKKEDDGGDPQPTSSSTDADRKQTFGMQPSSLESQRESSATPSTRDSLTSSRPAPPSPSLSRRTSAALSQRSNSSRDNLSRNVSTTKRQSRLQNEIQLTPSEPSPTLAPEQKSRRRSLLVKIRDFAFHSSDDRHLGMGPDAPRPNKHRRSSEGGSTDDDVDFEPDGRRNSGWSGFMWSGLASRLSWSFGGGGGGGGRSTLEGAEVPSKTDFERNFDVSSPVDEKQNVQFGVGGDEDEDDEDGEYEEEEEEEEEEGGPLLPGKYRAMYSFEPEGTAEMALEEDQIINVVGRGGGVGWAVVEKADGGHALVPESYLELVEIKQ